MARRYYNGAVRDFNIGIQSFPDVLIARLTGFHEEHFFQADADAAANAGRQLSSTVKSS